jgi:hypothetical protein
MASFYDDASLVVIPSGYKTSKIYAEKPTDGSGDLTFTRASGATRVGPNGLIEKVRTNLILQSQTFENASWAKVGVGTGLAAVVTANAGAAPDGTTTADRIVFNTGAGTTSSDRSIFRQSVSITEGCNLSFYIKSNTGSSQSIGFHNGGQIDIVTATTSWQRFFVNVSSSVSFVGLENRGDNATAGTCDVLVWGAQLETGDIATDYIPTTTAAVSVGPVSNVPRLDYLGSSCPRLNLEPQRTNLVTYSESFNNAAWQKVRSTITTNAATAPDGTLSADTFTDTTFTNMSSAIDTPIGATVSQAYTHSIFVKAGTAPFIYIGLYDIAGYHCILNASTGQITFTTSGATSSVVSYGNGWYRLSITRTVAAVTIYPYFGVCQFSNTIDYSGTGAYTAQFWGAQVEAGAYATSYIPTLSASVTRVADAASKTGISSLIGQTEGVIFLDFVASAQNQDGAGYGTVTIFGTATDNIQLYNIGTTLYWYARNTAALLIDQEANQTLVAGQRYKIAYAYKSGDYVLYINGVQKRTYTGSAVPAVSQFNLCGTGFGVAAAGVKNEFSQMLLFKTRLTNAQLAELTTL